MKQRIVFLLEQPLSPRNYERYGFELLLAQRFELEVWDFMPFLTERYSGADGVMPQHRHFVRSFPNAREADRAIQAESAEVFFINLIEPTPKSQEVYRALHRARSWYAVITANAIPAMEELARESLLMKLARLPRLIGQPKQLCSRAARKIQWLLTKSFSRESHGPALWIAGGTRSLVVGAPYPRSKWTRTVWAHTLDYDNYLRASAPVASYTTARAVFLDSFLPYHPDYAGEDMPPLDAGPYYSSLRHLFDTIEKRLGLTVEIACHPRGHYEDTTFGDRAIVKGRTAELVRDSTLVLTHWTTSVNYAVLNERPVAFLVTDAFLGRDEARYVEAMAKWLGKKPINIDRDLDSVDWNAELEVNAEAYLAYRDAFIKTTGSPELPFWQIVADAIRAELKSVEGSAD